MRPPGHAGKNVMKLRVAQGVILGVTLGLALGVGAYTFVYARGYSYMTDNAEACVNCHIMQEQFSGWLKSSHRAVAVCNDCHTPPGLVGKYTTKARNGFSGPEKRLVYPWAKGLQVENILAFYDEQKFKDWEHADTGAPVLKAQHPEFEMWNQGFMRAQVWPAPTATCLTRGKGR